MYGSRDEGVNHPCEAGLDREGTNVTAYAGPPPEPERTDYCWGGCPGAIEEAIEVLRLYDERCDERMPRLHVVFGAYEGAIDAKPGEKVVFVGDCARFTGEIDGERVRIESVYEDRSTKDPHTAEHHDIYAKMVEVTRKLFFSRREPTVRFEGCPVSVAEQVLFLANLGGVQNPYFDRAQIVQFNKGYLAWRAAVAVKRVRGQPYQKSGPCPRGAARPDPLPPGSDDA